ncbi:MAG: hypothetical protein FWH01_06535 [Oscillospiraceae bacterium]|nr:hypothetical protein [Oscillospiraceae bacterium]
MVGQVRLKSRDAQTKSKRQPADLRATLSGVYSRAKTSAVQCAAMFAAQCAAFPLLYTVFAKFHKEPFITRLCASIINILGAITGAGALMTPINDYLLRIDTPYAPVDFSAVWEKTGLFYIILILLGGAALLLLCKARPAQYAALLALCAAYFVMRYTALIFVYIQYPLHNIFWERSITFVSLAPLALILSRVYAADARQRKTSGVTLVAKGKMSLIPTAAAASAASKAARTATSNTIKAVTAQKIAYAILVASVSVLALATAAYFGFRDPGSPKAGRVVVDEYHSDWEWTDEAYDENWFGERSGYNYYCFYEYIDKHYITSRNMAPITAELLSQADVFIIKTPTEPFSADEVSALHNFVERGGGLYLIGDHTNVFGTSTNLNQIAPLFGIRFLHDCTYELTRGNLSEYKTSSLMPHPVVRDLPHFLFASSNTLETTMYTEDVILGYGLKNYQADYSQRNFFPEDTNSGNVEFGAFVQCAAASYKKGRVLAFTDSTVFSNFWMHMRGKPELLLGSLDWLNRENVLPVAPRAISLPLMLASALVAALSAALVVLLRHFTNIPAAASTPNALLQRKTKQQQPASAASLRELLQRVNQEMPTAAPVRAAPASGSPARPNAPQPSPLLKRCSFVLCGAFAASALFGTALFSITSNVGGLPAPIRPMVNIRFENEYSDIKLPIDIDGFLANMDRQLSTFYVWTQRLGYVPSLSGNLRSALADASGEGGVVVVSKPAKPFANTQEIMRYVNEGAVLLILDNKESGAHSNSLLALAGMEIVDADIQGPASYNPKPGTSTTEQNAELIIDGVAPTARASAVTGGTALVADSAGNALYSIAGAGQGRIAVFTDPDLFYNLELGDVSANLTDKTALLTLLALDIMKTLANDVN